MSHQLQALALDPAAQQCSPAPKGVTFARITSFSYCINHESYSTAKHIYHQPSPVTSTIWFLLTNIRSSITNQQIQTVRGKLSIKNKNHLCFTVGNVKSYLTISCPHHSQIFSSFPAIENKISEST